MKVALLFASLLITAAARAEGGPNQAKVVAHIKEHASAEGKSYQDKHKEVEKKINKWAKGELPTFRLGNSDPNTLIEQERKWIEDTQTLQCNLSDGDYTYGHTYKDLLTKPKICVQGDTENDTVNTNESDQCEDEERDNDCDCRIYFKYAPPDSGRASGICRLKIVTKDCDPLCIDASIVEYYLAVRKHNQSDQRFMSRYLKQDSNIDALIELIKYLPEKGGDKAALELKTTLTASALKELLTPPKDEITAQKAPQMLNPIFAQIQSAAHAESFGRVGTEANVNEDHQYFHPHMKFEPSAYVSDYDTDLSLWLKESQKLDFTKYDRHMKNPETCLRDNIATKKSGPLATLINPAWTAKNSYRSSSDIADWHCLPEVGELFPFSARTRRPHNSDSVFQTFVKTFQIYQKKLKDSGERAYSFRPDIDRLSLVPSYNEPKLLNEKLKSDLSNELGQYNCARLDQLSNNNLTYKTTNVTEVGLGAEATIEEFVKFKGCWGFSGEAAKIFQEFIYWGPSSFDEKELRYE